MGADRFRYAEPAVDNGTPALFTCFGTFEASMHAYGLGFQLVMDARDPSTGPPVRQPSGGMPSGEFDGALPPREFPGEQPWPVRGESGQGVSGQGGPVQGGPVQGGPGPGQEAFPHRQPTLRPPRLGGGRHRRRVPASLPQSAPALILAAPGRATDISAGAVGELASI